jgi:hypothetical protein
VRLSQATLAAFIRPKTSASVARLTGREWLATGQLLDRLCPKEAVVWPVRDAEALEQAIPGAKGGRRGRRKARKPRMRRPRSEDGDRSRVAAVLAGCVGFFADPRSFVPKGSRCSAGSRRYSARTSHLRGTDGSTKGAQKSHGNPRMSQPSSWRPRPFPRCGGTCWLGEGVGGVRRGPQRSACLVGSRR